MVPSQLSRLWGLLWFINPGLTLPQLPHIHTIPSLNLQICCETSLPLLCQRDVTLQCCSLKRTSITCIFVAIFFWSGNFWVKSLSCQCCQIYCWLYFYYNCFQEKQLHASCTRGIRNMLPRSKKATRQLANSRCIVGKPGLGRPPLGVRAIHSKWFRLIILCSQCLPLPSPLILFVSFIPYIRHIYHIHTIYTIHAIYTIYHGFYYPQQLLLAQTLIGRLAKMAEQLVNIPRTLLPTPQLQGA